MPEGGFIALPGAGDVAEPPPADVAVAPLLNADHDDDDDAWNNVLRNLVVHTAWGYFRFSMKKCSIPNPNGMVEGHLSISLSKCDNWL